MRTALRALTVLLGGGIASAALAETVVVDNQVQVRESTMDRPKRGITMTQVEKHFGAPTTRHPTVGKPPITRWDYVGYSVFFEHDRVIHTVVTGSETPPAPAG
jgi:hypothetical protein